MRSRIILVLSLFICWTNAFPLPVRVPVYTYPKDSPSYIPSDLQEHTIHRRQSRRPNSDFNRLIGNKLPPIQADESQANDDDYDQSDNEVPTAPQAVSSQINNQNKPLCVPFQAYPNNNRRYKRGADQYIKKVDPATGRTFLVLGNLNLPGSYGGQRPYYDNTQPQNDKPGYGLGQVQYQHAGGYPCIPINFGGNQIGNRPFGSYFGSYGGYRPGLGFFGNNGLLNFGGLGNYPQRPQFPYRPPFNSNRPGNQQAVESDTSGQQGGQQGFGGTVLDKLSEFVTAINPGSIYSSFGEALGSVGQVLMDSVSAPANAVRQVGKEFGSLIF